MDDAHERPVERHARFRRYDFDSMHLQVGSRLQLSLFHGTKPAQYFTSLIGYVKDEYLLVRIPFENGAPITLLDGERITVRAFSGTNVCTFFSTIERLFLRPLFYAHIAFPQMIEGAPLRQALRIRVNIPAKAVSDAGAELPVVISNVSASGALVESEAPLSDEDRSIELDFIVAAHLQEGLELNMPVHVKATVRNARELPPAPAPDGHFVYHYAYGVEFVEMEPTHRVLLQNLALEAMVEDRQRLL